MWNEVQYQNQGWRLYVLIPSTPNKIFGMKTQNSVVARNLQSDGKSEC
jgi:hypothetical protein